MASYTLYYEEWDQGGQAVKSGISNLTDIDLLPELLASLILTGTLKEFHLEEETA